MGSALEFFFLSPKSTLKHSLLLEFLGGFCTVQCVCVSWFSLCLPSYNNPGLYFPVTSSPPLLSTLGLCYRPPFPLPALTGNEHPSWISVPAGSVGGQRTHLYPIEIGPNRRQCFPWMWAGLNEWPHQHQHSPIKASSF